MCLGAIAGEVRSRHDGGLAMFVGRRSGLGAGWPVGRRKSSAVLAEQLAEGGEVLLGGGTLGGAVDEFFEVGEGLLEAAEADVADGEVQSSVVAEDTGGRN